MHRIYYLQLTNFLLNTNDIHKIVINPNKYIIHVASKDFDGIFCNISIIGGLGHISSYTFQIEVCEHKHPTDYKIVSEWINKIS